MAADPSARRRVGRQCRRYASAADQSPLAVHDTSGLQPANRSARTSAFLNPILPSSPPLFPDCFSSCLTLCSSSTPLSSPAHLSRLSYTPSPLFLLSYLFY